MALGSELGFSFQADHLGGSDVTIRNVVVTNKLANTPAPRFALFDLSKDVEEKVDVSKKHPKVFNRMKAGLQKIINDGRSRP